jgi:hypothetical protein
MNKLPSDKTNYFFLKLSSTASTLPLTKALNPHTAILANYFLSISIINRKHRMAPLQAKNEEKLERKATKTFLIKFLRPLRKTTGNYEHN